MGSNVPLQFLYIFHAPKFMSNVFTFIHARNHKPTFIFFFGIQEVLVCLFHFQNQPTNTSKNGKRIHKQHKRKQRTTITMSRMPHQGIPGPSLSSFVSPSPLFGVGSPFLSSLLSLIASSSSVVVRGAPFYNQGYIIKCTA